LAVARVAAAVIAIVAGTAAPARAAADAAVLLEAVVNGYDTGKVGEFVLRDGKLFARPAELRELGFRVPDSASPTQDGLVAVADLSGVTARLDQANQTLYATAAADRLLPALLAAGAVAGNGARVESGTGAMLGYDIAASQVAGQNVASGLFDLRGFSPWGVVSTGLLANAGASLNNNGSASAIRLDSTYVYSDPATLRRYRLGDFITGGLGWTRPVRLGGVQINSDFSMRPDLVTFPLPSVEGSVAVPSTVDVLVNSTRLLSRQVQPGPFQIPQLPVITGAGTVAMTVTDALGRQVTTTLPFYASSTLLAPGLQTYSVEFGAVRTNWGLISNDYRGLAGSASYRRGLSPDVTVEAHGEGAAGLAMAGGGVAVNFFNRGVVNAAAAASTGSGSSGALVSFGAQRIGQVFSFGASATLASHNFRDIATANGDPVPRRLLNANAGLALGRFGSFGVAYTGIDRDAFPAPISFFAPPGSFFPQSTTLPGGVLSASSGVFTFVPAQRAQILSASYSVPIGNMSLYATGFHDFATGGNSGVLFGLTVPPAAAVRSTRAWAPVPAAATRRRCRRCSQRCRSATGAIRRTVPPATPTTSSPKCNTNRPGRWSPPASIGSTNRLRCAPKRRARCPSSMAGCLSPTRSTTASRWWTPMAPRAFLSSMRAARWAGPIPLAGCWSPICGPSISTTSPSSRPTSRWTPPFPARHATCGHRTGPASWFASRCR
jgi:outer membrane usher protein